jgi:putative SOS response-associated peptidase YedK
MKALASLFDLAETPELPARYNIAPTQQVAAVRIDGGESQRRLVWLRWGLIPAWTDDPRMGQRLINARSESAAEKPAFRSAFRQRRCLIAADGFFEWQKQERIKQPFYIRLQGGGPFAFAGLWECWQKSEAETIETCTILTTSANELVRPLHDRMPVMLAPDDFGPWLDPTVTEPELVQPLLRPFPPETMTCYPVTTWVNSPKHEGPECVAPLVPADSEGNNEGQS